MSIWYKVLTCYLIMIPCGAIGVLGGQFVIQFQLEGFWLSLFFPIPLILSGVVGMSLGKCFGLYE